MGRGELFALMDPKGTGLSVGSVVLSTSVGFSVLFAVYSSLVSVYAARREELVLKRLRTGELRDTEILAGAAVRGYREAELTGVQGLLAAAGNDCEVSGPATGLPTQIQSALGRVVREAATNVPRHGDAGRCAVSLRTAAGR